MTLVALSFGSNLGDREQNITRALEEIRDCDLLRNIKVSSIINTTALLKPNSPKSWDLDFLNCVAVGETDYGVNSLLLELEKVERAVSKRIKITWTPREIDIDILLYGKQCIANEFLTVPHGDMLNRKFIIQLLSELDDSLCYTGRGKFYGMQFNQILREIYGKETV
ncbi:MAG: 2-amino-4-hydroxy-6-hydroxymethyldihydropteridine diphosphokinase [Alphaproteobacteria bacterium]|nr:2-amino-4-hydroxy-6-hydroxymethyldihydropteridine diphosphokinase [Alphaproteobacteria bacterium]